jgi:nucleoside recognition membrane protein YjiH
VLKYSGQESNMKSGLISGMFCLLVILMLVAALGTFALVFATLTSPL